MMLNLLAATMVLAMLALGSGVTILTLHRYAGAIIAALAGCGRTRRPLPVLPRRKIGSLNRRAPLQWTLRAAA